MLARIEHGRVCELRLDRPPANALNSELLRALGQAHERALGDGAAAIVVSGRPGMFSGGIDVPELLALDRPAVAEFWVTFFNVLGRLAGSPVPVAAAITGHSPAGGAVLAIHCDYRVAADGAFRIGLNEVQVGLPVPASVLRALGELVGPREARRLATGGQLIASGEAAALGLVDELAPPADVVAQAVAWCERMAALPPVAMNRTRLLGKAALLDGLARGDDARVATDYWFSAETQQQMRALAARLGK